jgi:hypothetical protein
MSSPVIIEFFRNKNLDMEKVNIPNIQHFTTSTYPKPEESIHLYGKLFESTLVRHKIETTA